MRLSESDHTRQSLVARIPHEVAQATTEARGDRH